MSVFRWPILDLVNQHQEGHRASTFTSRAIIAAQRARPAGVRSTVIVLLLLSSASIAGCTSAAHGYSESAVTSPATTPPTIDPAPSPPSATNCRSGVLSVAASQETQQMTICLRSGSTLKLTFDKSIGGYGRPGPWNVSPVTIGDPSILRLVSSVPRGQYLTADLATQGSGTTSVTAYFERECSRGDTTPCTIPPLAIIGVSVKVVAP